MKLTHKLCGAALIAAVGVSIAIPSTTKAENNPFKSDMDIQFTRNTADDTDTTRPNISGDDNVSGSITRNPVPVGDFGIMDVTPLSFGEQKVVTDGNDRTYWAKDYTEAAGVMANNVLIKDVRSTFNHAYTLTAQITKELTATIKDGGVDKTNTLTGAELLYKNLNIQSDAPTELRLEDAALSATATVTTAAPTTFVNNTSAVKGQGKTYIYFGKLGAANATKSSESVQLKIGKEQNIMAGDYKGEITWVLAESK
ncbi:WxL domain-containing protein [Enterococcus quebecensis]|uniref:WxL domain-containing protein n=1 Tax=Enterococcus quebecensis TaxID=903983 RepID=A0A1E5GR88_9ENTE|nr:WxL domain-containing protein [Enterococcus quebecensis]OEG15196.1 hypothetical protein BCR23_10185 [Enterococcus quebecensis]OJG74774.1 hypothetical protein RV12_GL002191 [Enterococcus quebecensis]